MSDPLAAFIDDLVVRMQDDLVHTPEVQGAAADHFPDLDDAGRLERVVAAVLELVGSGRAVVGDVATDPADGLLFVDPWPEQGETLAARLREEVWRLPAVWAGEGFWLSRPH